MQAPLRGYRQLLAWQKADDLASRIFRAVRAAKAPTWLKDQVSRSATSVPANIAEGYSRSSIPDYIRFLYIARGSLAETEYFLGFLTKEGFVPAAQSEKLQQDLDEVGRVLMGLIRGLAERRRTQTGESRLSEDPEPYLPL